jgi:Macrocin-O-methyltransferase (TylF)
MFDRLRHAGRTKLQRILLDALDQRDAEQRALAGEQAEATRQLHRAVVGLAAEVRGELAATREAVEAIEQRQRRDIGYALDRWATSTTADFVARELPAARTFAHPHDTLRWALTQAPPDGLALEFGVWSGTTLNIITPTRPRGTVFGFDSFEGLPERWRTGFDTGMFTAERPPDVPGAELVVGWFEDTLPEWAAEHPEPIAFLHLDADLYSSTATVLEHIGDRLVEGSIVVFDEYFNYPGWHEHEHRAWTEFVERTDTTFRYEAYTGDNEQVVVRITKPDPAAD